MALNLNQTNFDPDDPNLLTLFGDLQAGILKGHGRDQAKHIFISFTGDQKKSKEWLRYTSKQVTTATMQYEHAREFEADGTEHIYCNVMLSASGYVALGYSGDEFPDDKAFRAGMKDLDVAYDTSPRGDHRPVKNPLADNLDDWDPAFMQDSHVLMVLAYGGDHTSEEKSKIAQIVLDQKLTDISNSLEGIGKVIGVETGFVIRNEHDQVIEHFGYVDGVSNPVFFKQDIDREFKNGGFERNDPSAPLGMVLASDPLGTRDSFGSFFVYRKMQQNILGFKRQKEALAEVLSEETGEKVEAAYAGALAVGRFKDGTPVGEVASSGTTNLSNAYDYDNDVDGRKCPFQSHARQTNPRGDTVRAFGSPIGIERTRRIVRRGISYGSPDLDPQEEWTDAGLLFMCCQNNIEHQFIFMQHTWCNNNNFVKKDVGLDPLIGQSLEGTETVPQEWPAKWGSKTGDVSFSMSGSVLTRGGEYFFAPSLSFLRNI
jgi:Dyp-type peroxidase family